MAHRRKGRVQRRERRVEGPHNKEVMLVTYCKSQGKPGAAPKAKEPTKKNRRAWDSFSPKGRGQR